MARITGNTTDLVCDVLALLAAQAVHCDLFGGWAEELLGLRQPGPHADVDLVYRADSFAAVDAVIRRASVREIPEKRFSHKRAIIHRGILCELLLVQDRDRAPFTLFWSDVRFRWNTPFLYPGTIMLNGQAISVVSETNLILYRAEHRSTQPHRWRHPSSRLTTMLMDRAIR